MYAICVYEAMKNKAIISNISIRGIYKEGKYTSKTQHIIKIKL